MTTLALDLGQSVGWMKGSAVGPLQHGTEAMPNTTDLGAWLAGSDQFLPRLIRGADFIVIEQPFLGESYYPARKLLALLGHVRYHAHHLGLPDRMIKEIPIATGKLALSGKGNADKNEMIAACCDFWGFSPAEIDEHQADASGLLCVHFFGERKPIPKAKTRSSKGVSLMGRS